MRRVALILSFGVWICVFPAAAQPPKTGQWEPFEVTMSGSADFAHAYVDGLPDGAKPFVVVTFTGTSGNAKVLSYAVPGFWDGRGLPLPRQESGRTPPSPRTPSSVG